MAKTTKSEAEPETGATSQLGNGALPGSEVVGVDKIRDLLFGNQMQDYDRRFSKLEERFLQRFKDIEAETARNLSAFESNAKKQVDSLAGQLREEKDVRADADKEIERTLREHNQALEKRLRSMSDQLSQLERDMADRLTQEAQSLRDEIKRKNEDTPAHDGEDVRRAEQRQNRSQSARRAVRRGRQVPEPGRGLEERGQDRRRTIARLVGQLIALCAVSTSPDTLERLLRPLRGRYRDRSESAGRAAARDRAEHAAGAARAAKRRAPGRLRLEQLRTLLLGREIEVLSRLSEVMDDPEQLAAAIGRVLPTAIAQATSDARLGACAGTRPGEGHAELDPERSAQRWSTSSIR